MRVGRSFACVQTGGCPPDWERGAGDPRRRECGREAATPEHHPARFAPCDRGGLREPFPVRDSDTRSNFPRSEGVARRLLGRHHGPCSSLARRATHLTASESKLFPLTERVGDPPHMRRKPSGSGESAGGEAGGAYRRKAEASSVETRPFLTRHFGLNRLEAAAEFPLRVSRPSSGHRRASDSPARNRRALSFLLCTPC